MARPTRTPISPDTLVLSVVIPIYNERDTIEEILRRVHDAPFRKEIIVVDDGSTDGSRELLRDLETAGKIDRLVLHEENQGKGAALRSGFAAVTGHVVVVQDADLEYDPAEYPKLLQPFFDGKADVVYGSRFVSGMAHRVLFFWHSIANRCLTLISNMFTNLNLTDMETCYKAFRSEVVKAIDINEKRFGFEPEITTKVARMRCRIYEVGISYDGRGYQEGKKIGWKDAIVAFVCVLRYGLFYKPPKTIDALLAEGTSDKKGTPPKREERTPELADAPEKAAARERERLPEKEAAPEREGTRQGARAGHTEATEREHDTEDEKERVPEPA